MPKDEQKLLAEKRWKESADARAKKAAEKVALLIDSYYHLKKQIDKKTDSVATIETEKKRQEEKLAALHKQLEEIEMEIRKRQGDYTGDLQNTLTIDQLAKAPLKTPATQAPSKSATIHKFKPPKKG